MHSILLQVRVVILADHPLEDIFVLGDGDHGHDESHILMDDLGLKRVRAHIWSGAKKSAGHHRVKLTWCDGANLRTPFSDGTHLINYSPFPSSCVNSCTPTSTDLSTYLWFDRTRPRVCPSSAGKRRGLPSRGRCPASQRCRQNNTG